MSRLRHIPQAPARRPDRREGDIDAKITKGKAAAAAVQDRGPVLDPDVTELMRLSSDLQRATSRQLRSLWRGKKLSERGLFILELVNGGLDRPSRLIEYFDVLPSTITFETDKLVAAGLLTRESDAADRRVVRLRLTHDGLAVHAQTTEALNAVLRPRLDALSGGQLAQFLAAFQRIVAPLNAAVPARPCVEGAPPEA